MLLSLFNTWIYDSDGRRCRPKLTSMGVSLGSTRFWLRDKVNIRRLARAQEPQNPAIRSGLNGEGERKADQFIARGAGHRAVAGLSVAVHSMMFVTTIKC